MLLNSSFEFLCGRQPLQDKSGACRSCPVRFSPGGSKVSPLIRSRPNYSIADVVAKAVFGVLIWAIAAGKSAEEQEKALLG